MPLERVDDFTRWYGLRRSVVGHFHFKKDEIVVQRTGSGKLELTCGGAPIRLEELDSYVREFIATLFANQSVKRLALSKTQFALEVNELNAWGNIEQPAMELADRMYLERKVFLSTRPKQTSIALPATA
ncbi:MAG TPA: hypothetical protein VFT49_00815 [Candidatus Saccharimonadales bacterium]|nr:hypothetical protein [Candidatus Saccharimonadales bacterium]